MSDVIQSMMKDILDLRKRVARLEANDVSEIVTWTAWTPELIGATTGGTITYTTQSGYYSVINDMVVVYGLIVVNAIIVQPAGGLRIRTLPYTSEDNQSPVIVQSNVDLTAGYATLNGNFPTGLTFITLTENGDNVQQNYPGANLTAGKTIRFGGFYRRA